MKISEQVEAILKYVPKARDSDKELFIVYMGKYGLGLTKEQEEKFRKMPSLESLRRSRQLIQEQGKYPASEEVDKIRHEKFREMKETRGFVILNENYPN